MSELLGIDKKTIDDGVFQFYQTVLTHKVLEDTGISPTKVESPLGTNDNGP